MRSNLFFSAFLIKATLLVLMFCGAPARAQGSPWQARTFKGLPYRLLEPQPHGRLPLVICLHGAGERGDDNSLQLKNGIGELFQAAQTDHPCLVVVPQCPLGRRWVEVDWGADAHHQPADASLPMKQVLELLDDLCARPDVDRRRVYVLGLSMGGFGMWDLLARRPDCFAAAVSICGGADENTAAAIASIPVWVFHGDQDTVVKTERSRRMVEALRQAGASPRYTEYPSVGHDSWVAALAEPELLDWLFGQVRVTP